VSPTIGTADCSERSFQATRVDRDGLKRALGWADGFITSVANHVNLWAPQAADGGIDRKAPWLDTPIAAEWASPLVNSCA
jgi:hypothetical protein